MATTTEQDPGEEEPERPEGASTEADREPARPERRPEPPPARSLRSRKTSPGLRLLGGATGALLIALAVKSLAFPARHDLPPPISATQPAPSLPPPPADAAELDELRSMQERRTEAQVQEANFWQTGGAVVRWNEIARGLVVKYGTAPVVAARVFALLSVAQHDALVAAVQSQRAYKRPAPAGVTPLFATSTESTYPSEHAAVAAASAAVLSYTFGSKEQGALLAKRAEEHEESRLWAGVSRRSDIVAGDRIGHEVAEQIIARAKTDGAKQAGVDWHGIIPVGKDKWRNTEHPPVLPARPTWGTVRTWLMASADQFRPPPPPDVDSPEFATALDEVRRFSSTRTPEQLRIAQFWSDSQGTPTPPGHWNRIAATAVSEHRSSELSAARILALVNMAVMDAGIACWEAKYHYWFLRPSHVDPTITLPIGLPNFPSYPSGHSTFSGAAAEVLSYFFPAQREQFTAMADEASMSRIYGGIHYRFDADQGMILGRKIGQLAIAKAKAEGALVP